MLDKSIFLTSFFVSLPIVLFKTFELFILIIDISCLNWIPLFKLPLIIEFFKDNYVNLCQPPDRFLYYSETVLTKYIPL